MTTTTFREVDGIASMASDSRVTWIDDVTALPVKWFDSSDYQKTVSLDNVMYGFAGANVIFKTFLTLYKDKQSSEFLLDTLVQHAEMHRIQFFIIRYESLKLKMFAYSPVSDNYPEIRRISTDPAIDKKIFAIGSGQFSKAYKTNKSHKLVNFPIRKIIAANDKAFKKTGMMNIYQKGVLGTINTDEALAAYTACLQKGGDLSTGGKINMIKNMTNEERLEQVAILDDMDKAAKTVGAVCASPVDAVKEVNRLHSLGLYAVSPNTLDSSPMRNELLKEMEDILYSSVN